MAPLSCQCQRSLFKTISRVSKNVLMLQQSRHSAYLTIFGSIRQKRIALVVCRVNIDAVLLQEQLYNCRMTPGCCMGKGTNAVAIGAVDIYP